MQQLFSLDGKNALVVGGSRGLGAAMAHALAAAGANVVVASRNMEALAEVAESMRQKFGVEADVVACDVSDVASIEKMVARTLDLREKIDVLVNSAGTTTRKPAVDYVQDDWDGVLDVNLRGTFFCAARVAAAMIEREVKGSIINIASLASARGLPTNIPAYTASKTGVVGLTWALAGEWAPNGIRVNAIGPGYMVTEMTRPLLEDPAKRQDFLNRIPMGRFGMPIDLAGAVVFLASDASTYVTGQILYVDGGYLTR